MKKEDLVGAIAKQTWLSKKAASKVMHAVFAEWERATLGAGMLWLPISHLTT